MLKHCWFGLIGLGLALVAPGAQAQAVYNVTLHTQGLSGQPGQLVFDFTDGDGLNNNTVTVSGFSSDATLDPSANHNTAGAVGNLPGTITLMDTQLLTESANGVASFGSTASFQVGLTTNFTGMGAPDELATFALAKGTSGNSLVSTSDPTGASSLFTIDIDGSAQGSLTVYQSQTSGVSWSVMPATPAVPEPGSLVLLALGLTPLAALRRRQRTAMP